MKNNITYELIENNCYVQNELHISYGIIAYHKAESEGSKNIVATVYGITEDKKKLSELIDKCNRLKLSVMHLYDVIDDFLAE